MSEHKIRASGKRMEMADATVVLGANTTAALSHAEETVDVAARENSPATDGELLSSPDHEEISDTRPWHLMDNAPQDGTMIEVKEDPDQPDETAMMVRYYRTLVRDPKKRLWVRAAWWRTAITAEKLTFEPFCWRMPSGFQMPGMIVA